MRRIYGITGYKGAGKDTAGRAIMAYLNDAGVHQINFADPLKAVCAEVFGLTHDQMYGDQATKEKVLDTWPGMSPRQIMQKVGTECFRDQFPGVWIKAWQRAVAGRTENVVCTDYRFADEAAALKEADAVLIRVVRPGLTVDEHRSESGIADLPSDITLVNDCRSAGEFMAKAVKQLIDAGLLPSFNAKMRERMLNTADDEIGPEVKAGSRVRDTDDGSVGVVQAIEEGYGGVLGARVTWEGIGLTTWAPMGNLELCDVVACRESERVAS